MSRIAVIDATQAREKPTKGRGEMAKAALSTGPKVRESAALESAQRLTDKGYERVEEMIVTLQLPPGSAFSESTLSKRPGMSRTPVGEALQRRRAKAWS